MKGQNEEQIINIDLVNDILNEENKIKEMNSVLIALKDGEKKLEEYLKKMEKNWNLLYHIGLGVLIAILYIIIVIILSNSLKSNYSFFNGMQDMCTKILPTLILANCLQLLSIWTFQLYKKPIDKSIFNIRTEILELSKKIIQEIHYLNDLKNKQIELEVQEDLPKYNLETFLNKLATSPEYEMTRILDSLIPEVELPRKVQE